MELVERLIEKYGYDEPIFTAEVLSVWSEYSRPRVFQLLKELTAKKLLLRFDMGVYYVPTDTVFGKSVLDPQKVIEKRFIKSGNEVFGYYAGLTIENALGLTTQMPFTFEIVTTKETTRVRRINVGKSRVLLRRAKTLITKENAPVMQFLEVMKNIDEPLDSFQRANIKRFMRMGNIHEKDIYAYARYFPKRAIENFNKLGIENEIAL